MACAGCPNGKNLSMTAGKCSRKFVTCLQCLYRIGNGISPCGICCKYCIVSCLVIVKSFSSLHFFPYQFYCSTHSNLFRYVAWPNISSHFVSPRVTCEFTKWLRNKQLGDYLASSEVIHIPFGNKFNRLEKKTRK